MTKYKPKEKRNKQEELRVITQQQVVVETKTKETFGIPILVSRFQWQMEM
jgi:hypothetical protein